jgi:hypothetical protein
MRISLSTTRERVRIPEHYRPNLLFDIMRSTFIELKPLSPN